MSALLLYLLKANAVLLLFALAYFGLLRQLTFFTLNRAYLLLALGFAVVYPALPVPALFATDAPLPLALAAWVPVGAAATAAGTAAAPVAAAFDWELVLLALYGLGAAVMLVRLLVQLLAVARLRRQSQPAEFEGQPYRRLAGEAGPFSFWQTIYLNPAQHPAGELAAVLRHEQVHVRQWHTLDVLLAQLVQAAAWCNPAAWLLRRAVLDNLEYLADHHALQTGLDRRAYQYSLLRLSHGVAGPTLVTHFTFLTLKNRIAMMNMPSSPAAQTVRYLLAIPLVMSLALGFSAAQARETAPAAQQGDATTPRAYYLDGKLSDKATIDKVVPSTIDRVNVLKDEQARKVFGIDGGVIIVTTTKNKNSADVKTLEEKITRAVPYVPGTESPASISAIMPPALAYITKTYPDSRITGVTQINYPSTGKTVYKVELATGRRPFYVYFDERGNVAKF
jgi:hypothetical protein